jgi:Family of unknown function (DUF6069)
MTARTISKTQKTAGITTSRWLQIGLLAAAGSILAVLLVQAAILALWPELAAFKPLDSYARSALFTLIPAVLATAVFSWLVKSQDQPVTKFLRISVIVLLLSFIPDFLLPVANRTLAGSLAAASLHLVAGIVTVGLLLAGYTRSIRNGQ